MSYVFQPRSIKLLEFFLIFGFLLTKALPDDHKEIPGSSSRGLLFPPGWLLPEYPQQRNGYDDGKQGGK